MDRKSEKKTVHKAVVMYSGGADSTLALQLMLEQGIESVALNVKTPFCSCTHGGCAGTLGDIIFKNNIKVRTVTLGKEYLAMLKNPRYGYGRAMNPCSDCRIMMFRAACKIMDEEKADFVVSGEVVGQRPNSQLLRQMTIIERDSGLYGRLLRPLSAKLLPPTYPELVGMVDRSKLFDFQGRSRKPQITLARQLDLAGLPGSGGGCVLTEPRYADKVRDLYDHSGDGLPSLDDVRLLRVGRHFRFSPEYKVVVARDEKENMALERLFKINDLLLVPGKEIAGPTALVRGNVPGEDLRQITSLVLSYCRVEAGESEAIEVISSTDSILRVKAEAMTREQAKLYLI